MSILFKNAKIITTENDKLKVLKGSFLGVDGKVIDYIGTQAPKKEYNQVIDMYDKLLMPGLINGHAHTAMNLLKGVGSDLPLQEWLETIWPIEDIMREQDFVAGMEMVVLEMLACGTTSFSDMYMCPMATQRVVGESGIKADLTRVVMGGHDNPDYKTFKNRVEALDLMALDGAYDDRLHIDFSLHAEYTIPDHIAEPWAEEIQKIGGRFHTHLSETKREHEACLKNRGITPSQWFEKLGFFNLPTYAAHCVWVTDNDLQILKNHGVTIVHNPSSNMKLASGFAPIQKAIDMGINVSLGTDGSSSNNNVNMFEEMHIASIIHNGYTLDPTIMKPETVIKMATIGGAKAQGRPNTGSLEVGKRADIIAINLDAPHLVPDYDTLALVTYSAQGSDVCMTMVDGKILYKDGVYLTMDRDRIFHDYMKCHEYLSASVGR